MKTCFTLLFTAFLFNLSYGQSMTNKEQVESACMDYLDGFYTGDTTKIIRSIKPTLHKFGFWKDKNTGEYKNEGFVTFDQAKAYAANVAKNKRFPKADAPKKVEVLDVMHQIAAAKVTAWWGYDYILLSKNGDKWMIEQVLWEGPLVK